MKTAFNLYLFYPVMVALLILAGGTFDQPGLAQERTSSRPSGNDRQQREEKQHRDTTPQRETTPQKDVSQQKETPRQDETADQTNSSNKRQLIPHRDSKPAVDLDQPSEDRPPRVLNSAVALDRQKRLTEKKETATGNPIDKINGQKRKRIKKNPGSTPSTGDGVIQPDGIIGEDIIVEEEIIFEETSEIEMIESAYDENGCEDNEVVNPVLETIDSPYWYHWLSFSVGEAVLNLNEFGSLTHLAISSGRYIDSYNYIQLSAGYGWMPLKDNSRLGNIIASDISLLNLSLEVKTILPSLYTNLVRYFVAGMDYDYFSWRCKNPVITGYSVNEYGAKIVEKDEHDGVSALDIHAGLGFNIIQLQKFQLLGELSPGFVFPGLQTRHDFNNNVIAGSFYFKVKIICSFASSDL